MRNVHDITRRKYLFLRLFLQLQTAQPNKSELTRKKLRLQPDAYQFDDQKIKRRRVSGGHDTTLAIRLRTLRQDRP
jgi:hypothetical protein